MCDCLSFHKFYKSRKIADILSHEVNAINHAKLRINHENTAHEE